MRILVTGAQGCIGAWVTKLLMDRNLDILVYDRDPRPARLSLIAEPGSVENLQIQVGDIGDTDRVKKLVRDEGITHIIHLAALQIPACRENPVEGARVNVVGTLNVFEAAKNAGRPVRIVYASSAAVWGSEELYPDRRLTESDDLAPLTHYGVFKQANEGNARVFYSADGISSIGLRPWTVYGVGRDQGLTADPSLAAKAVVLGRPFCIRASGRMDLQYVEDVAEIFIRCALCNLEGALLFNLAGEIVDMAHFVTILGNLRPQSKGTITVQGPPVPVAHRIDDALIRAAIPDLPRTPLEQGLEKTLLSFERLAHENRLTPTL